MNVKIFRIYLDYKTVVLKKKYFVFDLFIYHIFNLILEFYINKPLK